jgi:putative ABC transport system permease protein
MIPLTSLSTPQRLAASTASSVHLLGRLRDGVSLTAANVALRTFWPAVLDAATGTDVPAERRATFLGRKTSLEPGFAGYSRVRNQFGDPLWLLLGLVALVLIVACASAANLLLARGISRHREIAVRLAIGAGRRRLVRQLLTESLVWTVLGAAAGLALALWGATALVALMTTTQEQIALDLSLNWRILGFSLFLAFATSVICAVVPAFSATRLDPGASLKETGQIGAAMTRRWSAGRGLVAAQVALTVVLLFGAALFFRSLTGILAQDAGFDRERLLIVSTDPEATGHEEERLAAFYDQLHERLNRLPGVESASLSTYPPISDEDGAWTQAISTDGNPVPDGAGQATVYFNTVSPGYFRTTGITLVRGRDFNGADTRSSPRVVIVNESLAHRFFPDQDPIGRQVTIGRAASRRDLTIVGLVRTSKYQRLQEEPRSIAYLPYRQQPHENLFTEVRLANDVPLTLEAIRREVRAIDPAVPMQMHSADDRIRESLVTERVLVTLTSTLGGAALVLACAGLYGMLA